MGCPLLVLPNIIIVLAQWRSGANSPSFSTIFQFSVLLFSPENTKLKLQYLIKDIKICKRLVKSLVKSKVYAELVEYLFVRKSQRTLLFFQVLISFKS